jgi:hypothetical protein
MGAVFSRHHRLTRDRIQLSLDRLDSASDGLVDFYCRLLGNISNLHRPRVRAAITILRYSSEKVSSGQLAILAVLTDLEPVDQRQDLEELRLQAAEFEQYLLGTCRYILKIEDNVVDFVQSRPRTSLRLIQMESTRTAAIVCSPYSQSQALTAMHCCMSYA